MNSDQAPAALEKRVSYLEGATQTLLYKQDRQLEEIAGLKQDIAGVRQDLRLIVEMFRAQQSQLDQQQTKLDRIETILIKLEGNN